MIIITADDLGGSETGIGAFGGRMANLTPNIDMVANKSVRFGNMHVNSAICVPSRAVLATGKYGFHSRQHGFFWAPDSVVTLMDVFQNNNYKTGIIGKLAHSSVKATTRWDYQYDYDDLGSGRSPSKYYEFTKKFIDECKKENKPFYFMINSHDPHRPFQRPSGSLLAGAEWPSKLFTPEEAYVPDFLPNLPEVKEELSWYYNSVRRFDDTFGQVMKAIRDAGALDNTVILFFSDNGISMPFAKANCYLHSTRVPFFVYMPGVLKPRLDKGHVVSTIDLFPTIMEMTGLLAPSGLDGSSILPLLLGKKQRGKNLVFTQIDFLSSRIYYPMRCVQDKHYGYIYNPWSNGKKTYKNANEGITFKTMESKPDDSLMKERVKMFRHREVEELYDLQKDPGCLHNLAYKKEYASLTLKYRQTLGDIMKKTSDPLLSTFQFINEPEKLKEELKYIFENQLKAGIKN